MGKLTPIERGVLFALMAEAEPLREAADLKARFNINMTPSHRKNLTALGLIGTKTKPFTHVLTDHGWQWAEKELAANVPPGHMGLGPVYAVLGGINRALSRRNIDLRSFFTSGSSSISDAAWSDSEVALAYALQDIPSFERVIQRFDASSQQKQAASLRQIELAAKSIFQNMILAAHKRKLTLSHVHNVEAPFDPVFFDGDEMLAIGEAIKVAKSPVLKNTEGEPIVVAKGVAKPIQ